MKLKENRTRFLPVSRSFSHSHSHCQKKASNLKSVPRLGAATVGRISTENIYSVSRSIISTRATGWYSTRGIFIYITCIKKNARCIYHTDTHAHCTFNAQKNACSIYITYIARNGHGRLWRLIAAGCNTEVFHGRNHCFRPLRPGEHRGYCLDFFAVIAMTAIHDEDSLDMVCDARRIKSVDPVIPLLSDEIKSLCVFPDGKNLSQTSQNIFTLIYFKLDSSHILFLSFLYIFI